MKIKGFVKTNKANVKEFVIVDFASPEAQGTLETVGLKPGALFRGDKIERLLACWVDGTALVCDCELVRENFRTNSFYLYNGKEWNVSADKYVVRLLTVDGQAPMNPQAVAEHFNGILALVKVAWSCVSTKGEFFNFPIEMPSDKAVEAATFIYKNSNGHAVVTTIDGTVTFDPKKDAVAAPAAKPAPAKKVEAAPLDKGYFYVAPDVNTVLSSIVRKFKGGFTGAVNVLVKGDSGVGKTSLAAIFAKKMGWSFHLLNCAVITEVSEIAGQRAIVDGKTVWEWSAVAKAIAKGNAVIVLDEITRAYPNALNGLFGLLDDNRHMWVGAEKLTVGPNVLFYATANIGSQFTGTFQADAALLNRFAYVFTMGNIPEVEEAKVLVASSGLSVADAKMIVHVATLVRSKLQDVPCPLRTTKNVAAMIADGLTARQAWEFALVNHLDSSYRKEIMDLLNLSLGMFSPANEFEF